MAAAAAEVAQLDPLQGQRHHALWLAALKIGSLVGGGDPLYEQAEAVLVHAGTNVLGLSLTDAQKEVRRGLTKGMKSPRCAPQWGDVQDRSDAVMRWFKWLENLDNSAPAFLGRKGTSLLRLHVGVGLAGMWVGKIDLGLSVRQASEATGLSSSTICTLMKTGRVEKAGFLHIRRHTGVRPDRDGHSATIWSPTRKSGNSRHPDIAPEATHPAVAQSRTLPVPAANVFHGPASAWRIHRLLADDEETTVAAFVAATGLTAPTVRANLKRLASVGLAERVEWTKWRATTADPRSIPSPDGVDHAARRHERHEREREAFAKTRRDRLERRLEERAREEPSAETGDWYRESEPTPIYDPETGEIVGTFAALDDAPRTTPDTFCAGCGDTTPAASLRPVSSLSE